MESIILFGSGGHARSVLEVIKTEGKFKVRGFFDSFREKGEVSFGLKVISNQIKTLKADLNKHKIKNGVIAVGDNFQRKYLHNLILNEIPNFNYITTIHSSATISNDVKIGEGTVVMAHAFVNSGTVIGKHVIINSSSSIDHDCMLNDFCSIAPGAILGGKVRVGNLSAICLGANIINGIEIGNNCVIGAGSLVVRNINNHLLAYGIPAKKIRERKADENYL